MIGIVNQTVAIATIISHIFLVLAVLYLLFKQNGNPFKNFLGRQGLFLAWLTSLAAVGLSLFYSNVADFPPCELCWWQRIFMYPQAVLLGLAWFKKDPKVVGYARPLAVIGALIALYHNYISSGGQSTLPCSAAGTGVSCTVRYVFEFGYITIPLMSLTAFLLLIFFLENTLYDSNQP